MFTERLKMRESDNAWSGEDGYDSLMFQIFFSKAWWMTSENS